MTTGAKGSKKDHKGGRNDDARFRRAGNEFSLEAMTASQVAVKRNQGFQTVSTLKGGFVTARNQRTTDVACQNIEYDTLEIGCQPSFQTNTSKQIVATYREYDWILNCCLV